jgi:peptide/nickel transport system substrate-binding protein
MSTENEKRNDESSISRRSLVVGAGATAAAAALASRGVSAAPGTVSGNAPYALRAQGTANLPTPRNQTVVMEQGTINVWDSFNPFIPNGEAYQYGLAQFCREYMFYTNFLTGEVTPWLATEYSYNADFTECTLKLNPAVTWNDGQPFTADDVVFTQTMLLENSQLNGAADVIRDVKSVTAADPQTVVWSLTRANTRFHYRFLAGIIADGLRVMPKHIWEGQDPGTFKFNPPVQTGPYMLQESSASKLYYLWKKNPNYWNKATLDPKPEYVMYVQATSVDTSVQDFLAGNTDNPSMDFLNQEAVASQTDEVARINFADPCPRGMYFNVESPSGLFATPEGRWAMSHLVNREVIASTIWQPSTRTATFPWADYDGWTPWATPEIVDKYDFSYDPAKANQLLDALGSTMDGDVRMLNGKPIQLTISTPALTTGLEYQIAVNFAESAKEAGIDVQVKSLPGSAFGDAFAVGDFDMTSTWICGFQFDPNQLYEGFHSRNYKPLGTRIDSGGDRGRVRLQDPEFDAIIEKLDVADPEDPANRPDFDAGLDRFLTLLPAMATIQTIYPQIYSTRYWTGWPTDENPFAIPTNWWGQFLFAVGALQPTGAE